MTPEELEKYHAKCDSIGAKLYSVYGGHFQRYEDAPQSVKDKYRHMAHMARVWWNGENQIPIVFDKPKEEG